MNDPERRQRHERWNEEMAALYDPDAFITRSGPPIRWVEALRLRRTMEALAVESAHSVLDVGCGPGNLLERLPGARVVGVDLSDTLLSRARARTAGAAHIEVLKADAESLPFPDSTFDRVVCSEVLEHVDSIEHAVAEIRRVAKPGARVVITLPNEGLINATKRLVLALGLKPLVAGEYRMSDNMLHGWHRRETDLESLGPVLGDGFSLLDRFSVPLPLLPYHRIYAFALRK